MFVLSFAFVIEEMNGVTLRDEHCVWCGFGAVPRFISKVENVAYPKRIK